MKRLLLLLVLSPLVAQAEMAVASIFAASTGAWEGETAPDGVTLIRRLTFCVTAPS